MRHAVLIASMIASLSIGTASAVEIVWTLTGLAGIYFTWDNLHDARKSIKAIRVMNGRNLRTSPEMRIIAFGHYRNEILRMLKCGVIVAVGVTAMLTPPVPHAKLTPVAVAITIGLLLLTALIVAASFLDRRQRDLLLRRGG